MVKSLEQYLSDLNFSPPEKSSAYTNLSAGEKVFIEKYLGMDALESIPVVDPEPLLQPQAKPVSPSRPLAEPKIEVIVPEIVVAPAPPVTKPGLETKGAVQPVTEIKQAVLDKESPATVIQKAASTPEISVAAREEAPVTEDTSAAVSVESPVEEKIMASPLVEQASKSVSIAETGVQTTHDTVSRENLPEVSVKESLKQLDEIQAVSFYVSGQLFLLPVAGIQEVLRHMELIRVPQAPPFVAGVINLRGKVTPLVHLSAILTNVTDHVYDPDKNFIIICGTEPLQVGLIIDRINSMHLLPQDKVIWNVESKLGDAADFLYALVNLDEKVCGLVAPDSITRRILAPDS